MTPRRSVLQALAAATSLGGLRIAAARPAGDARVAPITDAGAAPARVLPLLGGGALDAAFLDGVAQAVREQGCAREPLARIGLDALSLAQLSRRLDGDTAPRRVVALLDDAGAALALELLRAQGARLETFAPLRLPHSAAGAEQARAVARALAGGTALPDAADAAGVPCVALACLI
ncbi:hypothetical protein [Azohydromonas caseinilytica]|uniref:Uncharacterized protein n=1 Tax=Azohydromonas caseinilytica TaxID=2728836 RepID=A0A848FI02_9BURK|nr:hypothetical protein [Azohydromonas caseinilytica]NML18776.1 hypothetical protein [Azohydromonas caseinilytica]